MAWTELPALRNQRSRTYQDDTNPLKRAWSGTLAPLHYESLLDSGVHDTEANATPVRIDVPAFDGWRITASGWHYALGKDLDHHGDQDGWVGFGGRQGAHWFKFRLLRVGYLHWPTRAWDDIGGAPTYNRANLSQQTSTTTIGPNDDEISAQTMVTWSGIWTTPGGGDLSVRWAANADRLKEEIVINQAGREWIASNRPPATPLNETWFGFVFHLDWSDIPRIYRAGILQDPDSDWSDDGEHIQLKDALDRLLAFMPLGDVRVPLEEDNDIQPIRKRLWKDGDGNHYMLVGVRCDVLAGMAAGDLVFDPTVDKDVAANADDGHSVSNGNFNATATTVYAGMEFAVHYNGFFRWTGVTIDGTIDVSYMEAYPYSILGAPLLKIYGVDQDNPAAPTSYAEYEADPQTSAAVDWDTVDTTGAYEQSPSLNTIFQELVNSYTISNDAVILQVEDDQAVDDNRARFWAYEHGSLEAKLHIEYTAAGADAMPQAMHHYRMRRA